MDGFQERGSLAPVEVLSQSDEDIRTQLGVRASYSAKIGKATIRPSVRVGWEHNYGDKQHALRARFDGSDKIVDAESPELGRDAAVIGAGINVDLGRSVSVFVNDTMWVGRQNYSSNQVSGGIRIAF